MRLHIDNKDIRIDAKLCDSMTAKSIQFVAKPSTMGKRIVIFVPAQFYKEFNEKMLLNKFMKFHGEEILDSAKK